MSYGDWEGSLFDADPGSRVRADPQAETVDPEEELAVLSDEPDIRILECALAGSADAIITRDRAMLALDEFRGVRILSVANYLA